MLRFCVTSTTSRCAHTAAALDSNYMLNLFQLLAATAALIGLLFSQAQAQDESELAKKTQNPVGDLISVPLQSNFNFGAGSKDKMIYILNVQPVIPIKITEDWNMIARVVMPIINQPSLFPGVDSATGLGDINPTFFSHRRRRAI